MFSLATQHSKRCSVFPSLETLGNLAPWNYISTWRKCQGSEGVVLRNIYRDKHRLTYHLSHCTWYIHFWGGLYGCDPHLYVLPFAAIPLWHGEPWVRARAGSQVGMGHVTPSWFSLPVGNALELCPSSHPALVTAVPLSRVLRIRICIRKGESWCQPCVVLHSCVCLCGSSCLGGLFFFLTSLVLLTFESIPRCSFWSVLKASRLGGSRQQRLELPTGALPLLPDHLLWSVLRFGLSSKFPLQKAFWSSRYCLFH